jgi:hypothetical protein
MPMAKEVLDKKKVKKGVKKKVVQPVKKKVATKKKAVQKKVKHV